MISQQSIKKSAVSVISSLAITIGLMWLLPFLVHLIPFAGPAPLGAYLLPIFYAPLAAVWLSHPVIAILASLLMPALNHFLTGMPVWNTAVLLTFELALFSTFVAAIKTKPRLQFFAAPLAVLFAKTGALLLLVLIPELSPLSGWDYLSSSLRIALPGLAVLWGINLALIKVSHE